MVSSIGLSSMLFMLGGSQLALAPLSAVLMAGPIPALMPLNLFIASL